MRILLVQPEWSMTLVGFNKLARPEPLGLEILAGALPHHDVRILDLRVDKTPNVLQSTLASFQPHMVGVTAYTTDVPKAMAIMAEVKATSPEIYTVAGGHHASLAPHDFDRPFVDFIVVGEGEETFPQLVDALEAGRDFREIKGIIYSEDGAQ
ncbi:MAG: B12-binding domain-containing radical SAM protein, partial [Chloroflexota bacterium]